MQGELCAGVTVDLQIQRVKVHGNESGEGKTLLFAATRSRGGGLDLQEAASQFWGPAAAGGAQEPSLCVPSAQWDPWNHRMEPVRLEKMSKIESDLRSNITLSSKPEH